MTNAVAWETFLIVLKILYALCMLMVLLPGLNSLFLAYTYLRFRHRLPRSSDLIPPSSWPRVTIQLPIYNEGQLITRLLHAVTRLDYPRDRLEIQVLDDSTDETSILAQALVERYRREGFQIVYRHRINRQGYKAGNLASGLETATGELIAIFDADFIPPRNWLKRVVPVFQDPQIGFVQTRWVHYNAHTNLLARLLALAMDGHAIVEQGGRAAGGFFIGFDGSGGIWRRTCIVASGGWQWDTLTEDLDLAYRAQLLGWKGVYLPDVTVQAEVPETLTALRRQQYRWAKGSVQTLRKLATRLWRAPLPWRIRLEGLLHLSMYVPFPFAVLAFALILPLGVWSPSYFNFFFWSALGGLGLAVEYLTAQTETHSTWQQRLKLLPGMALLGIGISLTCAVGALDGLFHEGGVFDRTPKTLNQGFSATHSPRSAKNPYNYLEWGEKAMSLYLLCSALLLARHAQAPLLPWVFLGFTAFLLTSQGAFLEEPQPVSSTPSSTHHHFSSLNQMTLLFPSGDATMRKPLVAGNWKMNKTVEQARALVSEMLPGLQAVSEVERVLCPPFTSLMAIAAMLSGTEIGLGAQNMHWEAAGAFTGEISPAMVKEFCQYVILGHSERRTHFGETDETVNRKVRAALANALTPIVCIGETLAENEAGRTAEVVSRQIEQGLKDLTPEQASALVIAYEPVWAIGTGRAASGQDANRVVAEVIRPTLSRMFGPAVAEAVRVLYGGSVTAANAAEFFSQPHIDGALVGGASLKAAEFVKIVEAAAE